MPAVCSTRRLAAVADVAAICREYDVLFVADEVVSGLGRAGDWFGATRLAWSGLNDNGEGLDVGIRSLGRCGHRTANEQAVLEQASS